MHLLTALLFGITLGCAFDRVLSYAETPITSLNADVQTVVRPPYYSYPSYPYYKPGYPGYVAPIPYPGYIAPYPYYAQPHRYIVVRMSDKLIKKGVKLLIALVGRQIYEGILCSADYDYISLINVSEYPAAAKTNDNTRLKFYKNEVVAASVFQSPDAAIRIDISAVPLDWEQFEVLKRKSREYIYISMVDERYYAAMEHLEKCDVISVIALGCNNGRCDTIILICVATKMQVYIFDNLISNKRVIEMGLNKILASTEVKKIFHNCSRVSDCLQHVYNIELDHVFDTEIADLMLRRDSGKLAREARKLPEVVSAYMKLPANIIKYDVTDYPRSELLKRPLTDDLKLNLALQTVYLFYLKQVLERNMFAGFYAVCDALLLAGRNPESPCQLPEEFKCLAET
ncbi:uncharacterized protein CBL_03604 [Carabus blaptoides fortunei]